MSDDFPLGRDASGPVRRRKLLRTGLVASLATLAGCGRATRSGTDSTTDETTRDTETPIPDAVGATKVADGFRSPVGVEIPQPGRRFVVDQDGRVWLHDGDGLAADPYLDVRDRMVSVTDGYTEQGLLGLAFHPNFAENGRLFVRYSSPPIRDTPTDYSHTFVLSEFRTDPDARTVDESTERTLLTIPEPQSNHNAGSVAFGPDGYLYVGVGDGGGGGDAGTGHVDDWYDGNAGGNGQDVTRNLLGSVLRVDVDGAEGGRPYAIPDDNPLVGTEGLPEHYAWGFRNPWRLSFGPEGRFFVADVGQSAYEEVDLVRKGGNYGWNVREGAHCYASESCPTETPDGEPLLDPIIEYPHDGDGPSGIAVIGGYLYDGDALDGLDGRYVFADWRADGTLFVADPRREGRWPISQVSVDADSFGTYVLAFGRGPDGELYVCTSDVGSVSGQTGAVYRLTSV